jgi:hypothetical protein
MSLSNVVFVCGEVECSILNKYSIVAGSCVDFPNTLS